jgi:hypothetical protein
MLGRLNYLSPGGRLNNTPSTQSPCRYRQVPAGNNPPTRRITTILEGYIKAIKELKCDRTGRIQHYSPCQNFAFGWVDNLNPCDCDEF